MLVKGKSVRFGEDEFSWALLVKSEVYSIVRQIKCWSELERSSSGHVDTCAIGHVSLGKYAGHDGHGIRSSECRSG